MSAAAGAGTLSTAGVTLVGAGVKAGFELVGAAFAPACMQLITNTAQKPGQTHAPRVRNKRSNPQSSCGFAVRALYRADHCFAGQLWVAV